MGFRPLLPESTAGPIVVTFMPPDPNAFDPVTFCNRLSENGFQISLRRAAIPDTLRIGCMGDITEEHMDAAVKAVRRVLTEMRTATSQEVRRANRPSQVEEPLAEVT